LNDELLEDLTVGNGLRVGLSPIASLELLLPAPELSFLFLNEFNLSCFLCNSSICALENKKEKCFFHVYNQDKLAAINFF
jgi:hypothetical protein